MNKEDLIVGARCHQEHWQIGQYEVVKYVGINIIVSMDQDGIEYSGDLDTFLGRMRPYSPKVRKDYYIDIKSFNQLLDNEAIDNLSPILNTTKKDSTDEKVTIEFTISD